MNTLCRDALRLGEPRTRARQLTDPRPRPARQRGDREQEVVELNSKVPVRDKRNKKQESLEVKV